MIVVRLRRRGRLLQPGRLGPLFPPLAGLAAAAGVLAAGTGSARAAAGACPASNPPNELLPVSGSPHDVTNTATGVPVSMSADGEPTQEATINSQYGQPLQARVRDAEGRTVADVSVGFANAAEPTGAGASFLGAANQATGKQPAGRVKTKANGIAIAPALRANTTPGGQIVAASTHGLRAAFALINDARR